MRDLAIKYFLISLFLVANLYAENRTIGVLANRGEVKCMEMWNETADYLTENIPGTKFRILPLEFNQIDSMVKNERIDFIITNTSNYISLEDNYQIEKIATMVNEKQGLSLDKFGSVIFCQANNGIKSIEDVKEKMIYAVDHTSFGGFQMAMNLFLNNNIKDSDFYDIKFLQNHDEVVFAVNNDENSVGIIRTDILEQMDFAGLIDIHDFFIINKIEDDFPFVHSTELYPEWPIARLKKVPDKIALKVSKLLIELKQDSDACRAAGIHGWTEPLDYSVVRQCIENLKSGIPVGN